LHRYLVRLENFRRYAPKDTVRVLVDLRKSSDEFGSVVKNLRVSEKALEFDLYVRDQNAKDETIAKLESQFGRKLGERDLQSDVVEAGQAAGLEKAEVVRQSAKLFNEQRFWECHETLEQVWRREPKGKEKDVQQGVILAASAFVHYQRNENEVCLGMIPRALSKLDEWSDKLYYEIDLELLKKNLKEIEESKLIWLFTI
jgi:uncharacterized protein